MFLFVLLAPVLQDLLGLWDFERRDENRTVALFPEFDLGRLDKFPAKFDRWYSDHFAFRAPLLEMFQSSKFMQVHLSLDEQKSISGLDGWYFLGGKELRVYQNKQELDREILNSLEEEWQTRKAFYEERGITFYWLIAPLKHFIYENQLPPRTIRPDLPRRTDVLIQTLQNVGDFIIDPAPELQSAVGRTQVYYRTDTHWTHDGALIAWKKILEKLQSDYPQIPSFDSIRFTWRDSVVTDGFHLRGMGLWGMKEQTRRPFVFDSELNKGERFGFSMPSHFSMPEKFELHYTNPTDTTGLKLLVIRDSFADALIPIMAEWFSETLIIFDAWRLGLNPEIVEEFDPDIVLFLGLETHFENLVDSE